MDFHRNWQKIPLVNAITELHKSFEHVTLVVLDKQKRYS